MKRALGILLALSVGGGLGLGGLWLCDPYLPTAPYARGLRVGGQPIPAGGSLADELSRRQRLLRDTPVTLRHGEKRFGATLGALGAYVDVEDTLRRARAVGHTGSLVARAREARAAGRGAIDVPLAVRLDEAVARAYVERFAEALAVAPRDAVLDLASHAKIPDRPGQRLDAAASAQRIAASFSGSRELDLVTEAVAADVTLNDLDDIHVDKVLSSFETHYATYQRGRSINVELAAKKLDGLVMRPGQIVSFNKRVGARTVAAGFKEAPELVGDELSIGIGGGTCQVSSTLYAAALYGGLEVVARRSHSRPSGYTKLGLDATVSYGAVDLALQNPYKYTLVVHAFTPKPGILRVELLGGDEVESVEYRIGISNIEKFVRRITEKSWLKPGKALRKQQGTRGMDVHSFVTIHFRGGRVVKKQTFSSYRPYPEVFWVAPGYALEELPDLPEHASGLEGREDIYDG